MTPLSTVEAQSGVAFPLAAGAFLEVIDPQGGQVADLFCAPAADPADTLSSGRSIDYADTIRFTTGKRLYAHSGQPLLEIAADTCGTHDFLVTPCSLQMFRMLDPGCRYHPSCEENLARHLGRLGVDPRRISTTFNIFMNVPVADDGTIRVHAPKSGPGDRILFRALCDLLVGLTACSDEGTNGGSCKPIQYRILPAADVSGEKRTPPEGKEASSGLITPVPKDPAR